MAERRPKTLRDMVLSMSLLAVVALVLLGMYGWVTVSPGGPSEGQTPTADVPGGLQRAAPLMGFPVLVPADLPADWTASSFSYTEASAATDAGPAAVRGGWLTEEGRFLTLVQSDGAVTDVLSAELGAAGSPTGSVLVDGDEWTVTAGRRDEQAWVRTVGNVTLLITGTASEADFRRLAEAAAAGSPAS